MDDKHATEEACKIAGAEAWRHTSVEAMELARDASFLCERRRYADAFDHALLSLEASAGRDSEAFRRASALRTGTIVATR